MNEAIAIFFFLLTSQSFLHLSFFILPSFLQFMIGHAKIIINVQKYDTIKP